MKGIQCFDMKDSLNTRHITSLNSEHAKMSTAYPISKRNKEFAFVWFYKGALQVLNLDTLNLFEYFEVTELNKLQHATMIGENVDNTAKSFGMQSKCSDTSGIGR